jgi:N-acetylglucosamine malate deacetylase 1
MNKEFKNVLVLAPHTDDGELGCGGTISKLVENGSNVYYIAFSTAEQSLNQGLKNNTLVTEVKKATKLLGIRKEFLIINRFEVRKLGDFRQEILEKLVAIKNKINFDLIFLPSMNDIHQDHLTIAQEGVRAFKNTTILGYELIWNNLAFNTTSFVRLEEKHIEKKVSSLHEYKSQKHRNYMTRDFIYSLARTRGVQIGAEFAESFEVIRFVI